MSTVLEFMFGLCLRNIATSEGKIAKSKNSAWQWRYWGVQRYNRATLGIKRWIKRKNKENVNL